MNLRTLLLAVAVSSALASASVAEAQGARPATLKGTVFDAATAVPLIGARVVVSTTGRFVTTDSSGRFEVTGLASGIVRFYFSAEGFPQAAVVLAFAPGEVMEQRFELDSTAAVADSLRRSVQPLAAAEISAAAPRGVRYEDFERRMRTGRGHYVTKEQIEAAGHNNIGDAVRGLRGVAVECGGGRGCNIRMVRANQGCYPTYVVDGREDNFFGPMVAIRDIEGMEIYTGASDVPGEFAGWSSACGVVVIWTKSGPVRKPSPLG